MPGKKRSKQLPYLTQYIRYAVDWRRRGWNLDLTLATMGIGVAISLCIGITAFFLSGGPGRLGSGILAAVLSYSVYMLGAYRMSIKRGHLAADSQVRLRREAMAIAERLEECLDKRRLERDLSVEVSTLLEEASRNWHRAQSALESPYWRRADLPAHLRSVREQSLVAIDQGMQEMLVLFATSIPEKPGHWTFSEVVDEVVGQDFLTTKGRLDHISPFYREARSVAEKLNEMAEQVESVSRQIAGQELIVGAPKPGSALEATLSELRQFKEAEEELHQDLHLD